MAYMNQETKAMMAPAIKDVFKKYGVKGSLAVANHRTLVANIKSGPIDFIGNYNETVKESHPNYDFRPAEGYIDVNPYWYHEHFSGVAKLFLLELLTAMNTGNHDRSDIQTDYFDVGWYVDVNIGKWNKPYVLTA